ncbi:GerAB/ArcD/ProY family transporter [Domibacillus indicus]|uniref:GerAB/ArcD/ProY family transporter n=1 Tax=Domibacillus indicus TaxID=1437523 RepID=UPI0006183119|nr:GerAB/ArcD/ProY family transporter [Domibacillus indicus]
MEKARISAFQLFILIVLFELGSAMIVPLAIEAKQGAWLAILIGAAGGCGIFLIYYALFRYYPDESPVHFVRHIIGSVPGKIVAFLYILYFLYLSARVVRDFGEMLITIAYVETPLFVLNLLMVLLAVYTIRKGIEVLARTGELLFIVLAFLFLSAFLLIAAGGTLDYGNLKPVMGEGLAPIVKTAFTQTIYFPFGEIFAFMMIMPYVTDPKKVKRTGLLAITASGFVLASIMAANTGVLGVELVNRSLFPLLATIQSIELADFLERLDVYFMLAAIIGGFVKITLFLYVSVAAAADLFKVKKPSQLAYPLGVVVLLLSIMIAGSLPEHIQEGIKLVPLYLHLPFQVILPALVLLVAFVRHKGRGKEGEAK